LAGADVIRRISRGESRLPQHRSKANALFLREFEGMSASSRSLARHAGFINILHVGRTAEYLYYSMELADDHLDGTQDRYWQLRTAHIEGPISRGTNCLSADESIRLGLSLTEALEALHKRGLTHRDIKPSNIIFSEACRSWPTSDWWRPADSDHSLARKVTSRRKGPGTPRADIYSLGKLLYETCTGKDRSIFPEVDSQLSTRPDRERLLQTQRRRWSKRAPTIRTNVTAPAAEMHRDLTALNAKVIRPTGKSRVKNLDRDGITSWILLVAAVILAKVVAITDADLHLRTTIRN
jgi:serine/threonine protein kinase